MLLARTRLPPGHTRRETVGNQTGGGWDKAVITVKSRERSVSGPRKTRHTRGSTWMRETLIHRTRTGDATDFGISAQL